MGFCTTINPRTGREVLVCDFCGGYPVRKVRCPYGWCQAWAACARCRSAGKCRYSSCGAYDESGVALPHKVICRARILSQQWRLQQYGKRYDWELSPAQAIASAAEEHALVVQLATRYGLNYRPMGAALVSAKAANRST